MLQIWQQPEEAAEARDWQPGDLMLFWGSGWISRAIEIATNGPSHVGIVAPAEDTRLLLWESTTLCQEPCEIVEKWVSGMQAHCPERRLARYGGTVARMRLLPAWQLEWPEASLMGRSLRALIGCGYDTPGALLSGTKVIRFSRLMPYPDLGSLFCSEACAHVLMRVNRMPLSNPSAFSPARLVRRLLRCGTYSRPEWLKT